MNGLQDRQTAQARIKNTNGLAHQRIMLCGHRAAPFNWQK
jgi:hypothetical protein